jgi:hypothetical protein
LRPILLYFIPNNALYIVMMHQYWYMELLKNLQNQYICLKIYFVNKSNPQE